MITTKVHLEALLALQLVNELPTEQERDEVLQLIGQIVSDARERARVAADRKPFRNDELN